MEESLHDEIMHAIKNVYVNAPHLKQDDVDAAFDRLLERMREVCPERDGIRGIEENELVEYSMLLEDRAFEDGFRYAVALLCGGQAERRAEP